MSGTSDTSFPFHEKSGDMIPRAPHDFVLIGLPVSPTWRQSGHEEAEDCASRACGAFFKIGTNVDSCQGFG